MIITPSDINNYFKFDSGDNNAALFPQLSIYTLVNNISTLVVNINGVNVGGGSYFAYYQLEPDTTYFLLWKVYTDNTYTVVSGLYSSESEVVYSSTILSALTKSLQSIQAGPDLLGIIEADLSNYTGHPYSGLQSLILYTGESRTLSLRTVYGDLSPVDLSTVVDIQVRFLGYDGSPITKSLSDVFGGVTVVDALNGRFSVELTVSDTGQFRTGEQLNFSVYLYYGNFSSGTYSGVFGSVVFGASAPGTDGNVSLEFDGLNNIDFILNEFGDNNPTSPSITFSPTGDIRSRATVVINYTPTDGQTLTISDSGPLNDVYTFKNSPSGAFEVQIGDSPYTTLTNLIIKLNASGGDNYTAVAGPNGNIVYLYAGDDYPNTEGNDLSAVASNIVTIAVTNFAGGTNTVLGSFILPSGELTLSGGTDNTRIANFSRALNVRSPSI